MADRTLYFQGDDLLLMESEDESDCMSLILAKTFLCEIAGVRNRGMTQVDKPTSPGKDTTRTHSVSAPN